MSLLKRIKNLWKLSEYAPSYQMERPDGTPVNPVLKRTVAPVHKPATIVDLHPPNDGIPESHA